MILSYRVLERRTRTLRGALLHVFFVLKLDMHKYDDLIHANCDKKGKKREQKTKDHFEKEKLKIKNRRAEKAAKRAEKVVTEIRV